MNGIKQLFLVVCVLCSMAFYASANPPIVLGWGDNEKGQLGMGDLVSYRTPERVEEDLFTYLTNVQQIACGGYHTLGLMPDGTVKAWGYGFFGQLGQGLGNQGDELYPIDISGLNSVTKVIAGGNHSVALMPDNTIMTWGNNINGQLGRTATLTFATPTTVSGLPNIRDVACGMNFTFAITTSNTLIACGNNSFGQLGVGSISKTNRTFLNVPLTNVAQVSCGDAHTVALCYDGSIYSWGNNQFGQLAIDDMTNRSNPTLVTNISGVSAIACGGYHTLFLMSDSTIKSCGWNIWGQLGLGDTTNNRAVPETVLNITNAATISAGNLHSMTTLKNGKGMGWGCDALGQLGNDLLSTNLPNGTPMYVEGLAGATNIVCGNSHTMSWGLETPVLEISPDSRDFGLVPVNETEETFFRVENTGFGDADLSTTVGLPFQIFFSATLIPEQEWRNTIVRFTPPSPIFYSNNVEFTSGSVTYYHPVTGTGWLPNFLLKWTSTSGSLYNITRATSMDAFSYIFASNLTATAPTNWYAWTNSGSEEAYYFYRIESTNETGVISIVDFQYQ